MGSKNRVSGGAEQRYQGGTINKGSSPKIPRGTPSAINGGASKISHVKGKGVVQSAGTARSKGMTDGRALGTGNQSKGSALSGGKGVRGSNGASALNGGASKIGLGGGADRFC